MVHFKHQFPLRCTTLPRRAVVGAIVVAHLAATPTADAGERASAIVQNQDGSGTTIVKPLPDGSTFQVQNSWTENGVNGIQRFPDDAYAFLNCLPEQRTATGVTLGCSVYDQATGQWGPPIVTTVANDFLNGDLVNPYNSLFSLPGDYVTFTQIEGESTSYALRLLDAAQAPAGFPFIIVQTNPATRQAFALRNTDVPGGTTESTNFSFGIQTDDYCIDFDVTPVAVGGPLAGTYGARRRNDDGTCGEQLFADRSTSIIPAGGQGVAGTYCRYRVASVGSCVPPLAITSGDPLCVTCAGSCRDIGGVLSAVVVVDRDDYAVCTNVRLELEADATCATSCDTKKGMSFIRPE